MTDDDGTAADDTPEPPKSDTEEFYERLTQSTDFFGAPNQALQKFSDSAGVGGSGKGIPITLFLHGATIGGHICSGQEFYRAQAEVFRNGVRQATADGELPEYADNYARMAFESVAEEMDKAIEDDDRAFNEHGTLTARWALTRSIYLMNAYYTVPGAQSIKRDFVCVNLSQVVGWTLGVTTWGQV